MDNPQQKYGWGGVIAIVFIIAAVSAAVYFGFFFKKGSPTNPSLTNSQSAGEGTSNINFEKIGNLVRNNPGLKADVWYLTYEEAGKPALNTELAITASSTCLYGMDRELPCELLEFDQGERVKITGAETEGAVAVKTIMPYVIKGAPWEDVASFIGTCQVTRANQASDLTVKVWLKNDMEIWTEEPALDDLLTETDMAKEACGEIPVGAE